MKPTFQPVLFHRPNNLISKGIRAVTGSYWNHCAALFFDEQGDLMLLEAVEGGVRIWLWSEARKYYDKFNCEYFMLPSREMVRNYKPLLGAGYEFMAFPRELLYFGSQNILGKENKFTKYLSNIDDPTKFVCFELISYLQGDKNTWGATGLRFDNKKNNS